MITDHEKTEIGQKFVAGLSTRNWPLLRSIMAEDVVWSLPGTSQISGEAVGTEAVVQRAQRIVSYGLTFNLKHLLLGQHGVALSLHNTARRDDAVLDLHLATVLILRDGKASTINTYMADVEMVNRFFVPMLSRVD
jgi:ketosteroid isomerase-like protein